MWVEGDQDDGESEKERVDKKCYLQCSINDLLGDLYKPDSTLYDKVVDKGNNKLVPGTMSRHILPKGLRALTNRPKAQCCCSGCLPMGHMQQSLNQFRRGRLGELEDGLGALGSDPPVPAAGVLLAGGKPKGHEPQALPGAT